MASEGYFRWSLVVHYLFPSSRKTASFLLYSSPFDYFFRWNGVEPRTRTRIVVSKWGAGHEGRDANKARKCWGCMWSQETDRDIEERREPESLDGIEAILFKNDAHCMEKTRFSVLTRHVLREQGFETTLTRWKLREKIKRARGGEKGKKREGAKDKREAGEETRNVPFRRILSSDIRYYPGALYLSTRKRGWGLRDCKRVHERGNDPGLERSAFTGSKAHERPRVYDVCYPLCIYTCWYKTRNNNGHTQYIRNRRDEETRGWSNVLFLPDFLTRVHSGACWLPQASSIH